MEDKIGIRIKVTTRLGYAMSVPQLRLCKRVTQFMMKCLKMTISCENLNLSFQSNAICQVLMPYTSMKENEWDSSKYFGCLLMQFSGRQVIALESCWPSSLKSIFGFAASLFDCISADSIQDCHLGTYSSLVTSYLGKSQVSLCWAMKVLRK